MGNHINSNTNPFNGVKVKSMDVGLIADLHLGHLAMARMRGYSNLDDYHKDIIDRYNSVAHKKTMMIIPGDVTMEKKTFYPLLNLLNGRKIVVGGNHDLKEHIRDMLNFVETVVGAYKYKGTIITHIPIHPMEVHRYRCNIHGHIHDSLVYADYKPLLPSDKEIPDERYKNVSWERLGGVPISFNQLMK